MGVGKRKVGSDMSENRLQLIKDRHTLLRKMQERKVRMQVRKELMDDIENEVKGVSVLKMKESLAT